MKTPYFGMTPDFTPVVRMMAMQTQFAVETSQSIMQIAMLPMQSMPTPFGLFKAGLSVTAPSVAEDLPEAPETVAEVVEPAMEAAAEVVETVTEAAVEIAEAVAPVEAPQAEVVDAEVAAPEVAETVVEAAPVVEEPVVEEAVVETAETAEAAEPVEGEEAVDLTEQPEMLDAPKGDADDLTVLNGVGPKLAEALNAAGIYHYAQIAAWSEANVAWVDDNIAGVRGRASRNGWAAQAAELA